MAKSDTGVFTAFSKKISVWMGQPATFLIACVFIMLWLCSGPLLGFSDTWQLIVNTTTTIITFLMVFLIQNTQNRDTEALQIKIDELIRVTKDADKTLLDLEELDEKKLDALRDKYEEMAREARKKS